MKLKHWLKGLAAAVITSMATSVLSSLGTNVLGIGMTLRQLGVVCVTAGLVGAAAYLKQSPVPPDEDDVQTSGPGGK